MHHNIILVMHKKLKTMQMTQLQWIKAYQHFSLALQLLKFSNISTARNNLLRATAEYKSLRQKHT
jgi:hypothetical protein